MFQKRMYEEIHEEMDKKYKDLSTKLEEMNKRYSEFQKSLEQTEEKLEMAEKKYKDLRKYIGYTVCYNHGHVWGDWEYNQVERCTSEKFRTCKLCGRTEDGGFIHHPTCYS